MRNPFRRSELELRGPRNDVNFYPRRSRLWGSASFCALSPMVKTKRAGGRAGGALQGGSGGGRSPSGRT
eukprot:15446536-Alexandrium_andersonii.AAC.1